MAGYIGSKIAVTQVDGYNRTEADAEFVNDPNDVITVSGSNVGIGTSSPASKLHVQNEGGGSGGYLKATDVTYGGDVRFGMADGVDNSAIAGTWTNNSFLFYTNGNERMRIKDSGEVGIGTSNPQREVQIHDANATNAFLAINHTGVGSGATDGMLLGVDGNNDAIIHNYENSNMIFRTNDIERLRINGSGAIYFNTSSNQGTTGNGTLNILVTGGDAINLRHTVNGNHVFNIQQDGTNPTNFLYFSKNGSNVGSIYCTTSSTSYNTSSDYRLKENVTPLDGAADRLAQIPVHRFNFIADPDTTVDGFLAHEVQAFVPEAITGGKDAVDADGNPIYQGIDQSKLVPLLTAALQEALQKIDALEARVAALEAV